MRRSTKRRGKKCYKEREVRKVPLPEREIIWGFIISLMVEWWGNQKAT